MSHTDLNQHDLGPLRAAAETTHDLLLPDRNRFGTYGDTHHIMNAALGGVLHAFEYPVTQRGSGGAWPVTGRGAQDTEAGL